MAEKTILSVDLYDNILTSDPNDYTGKVNITGTVRNSDIAARIVAERTEYRKETIENILNLADQKKIEAIAEGKSLIDGVGQYLLNISGSFVGKQPVFDSQIHKFGITYTPGKMLQSAIKLLKARVQIAQVGPVVNDIIDSTTGRISESLTAGGPAVINGNNLILKGEDPSIGVWFQSTGEGEKQKVSVIVANTKSQIIISVPQLKPGEYTLIITSQTGANYQLLKAPRTYEFPIILTVDA